MGAVVRRVGDRGGYSNLTSFDVSSIMRRRMKKKGLAATEDARRCPVPTNIALRPCIVVLAEAKHGADHDVLGRGP